MTIEIKELIASLVNNQPIKENSPKLVRDNIPQIYADHDQWQYHTASITEFRKFLRKKLLEETEEFLLDESLDEIADILEVLTAFAELKNWKEEDISQAKLNKASTKGNFSKRLIATKLTSNENKIPDILNITTLQQTIQKFVDDRDWEQFHNPKNLVAALTVEASELLEIFQWLTPEQAENAKNDPVIKEKISHELADIMIYLIQVADKTEVNLHSAIIEKLQLAALKYPAERVRGQSKKYNEYAEWSA